MRYCFFLKAVIPRMKREEKGIFGLRDLGVLMRW